MVDADLVSPDGEWHHVCVVVDSGQTVVYVDGTRT
jgi:hypothetical protein